jgi:hypothetical protein
MPGIAIRLLAGLLLAGVLPAGDGDPFRAGVALLKEGKAAAALARLREAEKSFAAADVPAELLVDLAIAAWQAGEPAEAEAYAERAAAKDGEHTFLRDMVVGGARLAEGQAALGQPPSGGFGDAIDKAARAIAAFESALRRRPESEAASRNLERALRAKEALEERKRQQDEQQKKDEQDKPDKQDKSSEEGKQDEQGQQQNQQDQQKPDRGEQKQPPEEKPDQRPEEKPADKPEEKPGAPEDEPKPPASRASEQPAGEGKEDRTPRLLSKEEAARLLRTLEEIEKRKLELRLQQRPRHVPGKKDW